MNYENLLKEKGNFMKKNKRMLGKSLIMILAMSLCFVMLTSCGKAKYADSKYLGKWSAKSAEYQGIQVDVKKIAGGDFIVDLKEDGKCEIILAGKNQKEKGEWEETEKGFKVKGESESDSIDAKVDGNKATIEYEGVEFIFEKK